MALSQGPCIDVNGLIQRARFTGWSALASVWHCPRYVLPTDIARGALGWVVAARDRELLPGLWSLEVTPAPACPEADGAVSWFEVGCVPPVLPAVELVDDESEEMTARNVTASFNASAFFKYTTCTLPGVVVG